LGPKRSLSLLPTFIVTVELAATIAYFAQAFG